MTKGAIYGNFKNKEQLAVEAFKYNIRAIVAQISLQINKSDRAVDKLFAITNYYRGYYDLTKEKGGCPILNVGSDTRFVNPVLFKLVRITAKKLEASIADILYMGVSNNEFKRDLDIQKMTRNIYSMLEGSIFMATTHDDRSYLVSMMDHLDGMIKEKIIA